MKKRVLFFGDSNTYGINPKNFRRYDEDTRFTGIIQNTLKEKATVIEEGLLGRTTLLDDPELEGTNGLAYLVPCLNSHAPIDKLVLMLGTNDARGVYNITTEQIAENIKKIIIKIKVMAVWADTANILLISPHPIMKCYEKGSLNKIMGSGCDEKTANLGGFIAKIAEDMKIEFIDAAKIAQVSEIDGIHYTKKGHELMAKAILSHIE